jgi:RNA polymerase sigma-70 factor (ECF subfamily)
VTDHTQRIDIDALYRTHAARAFRRAQRLLGDEAEAHELVHDVFLNLFERPEQFRGASTMSTYLYSAVTYACLNRVRDRANRLRLLHEHGGAPLLPAERPDSERLAALRAVLARLPEPLAQVAVYYYMDELTHDDIARILGCSRRHVGNLLDRLSEHVAQLGKEAKA